MSRMRRILYLEMMVYLVIQIHLMTHLTVMMEEEMIEIEECNINYL